MKVIPMKNWPDIFKKDIRIEDYCFYHGTAWIFKDDILKTGFRSARQSKSIYFTTSEERAELAVKFEMQQVVSGRGLHREFDSRDVFGGGRSGVVGLW